MAAPALGTLLEEMDQGESNEQATSATPPPLRPRVDAITVDRGSYCVGDTVMLTWEVHTRPLHERDFIGMFEVHESDDEAGGRGLTSMGWGHGTAERLLDSRVRGDTSICGGCLQWTLTEEIFPRRKLRHTLCEHRCAAGAKRSSYLVRLLFAALVHNLDRTFSPPPLRPGEPN